MWVISDAILEATVGRQVHIAGVSHRGAVDDEAVFEGIEEILLELCRPDAVAITLHGDILGQHLTLQLHLLGLRGFHTEDDALLGVLRRDDGTWEQTGHHASCELLLLTSLGGSRLSFLHGCLSSFLVEEQGKGLVKEVLGIHPRMSVLIGSKLLDALDAFLVEELHVVAGVAIEEVVGTHTEPEEVNLLVGLGGIVVDVGDVRRCE